MNGIDPKWILYLGIAVTIEQGIGQGSVKLTNVVPNSWIPFIDGWCTLLAFIGNIVMTAMAGYSSKAAGPLVKPLVLAVVIIGGLFSLTSEARAQVQPRLTGNIVRDIAAANPARSPGLTGNPLGDIIGALDVKLLPDLISSTCGRRP